MSYRQQRQEQASMNRARDYMDERIIDKWDAMRQHPSADPAIVNKVEGLAQSRGLKPLEDGRYERACLYNYRRLKEGRDE